MIEVCTAKWALLRPYFSLEVFNMRRSRMTISELVNRNKMITHRCEDRRIQVDTETDRLG